MDKPCIPNGDGVTSGGFGSIGGGTQNTSGGSQDWVTDGTKGDIKPGI